MSVSIIIRTKNEEALLGKTLEMIYKQSYKNFEILIIDSGSTDKTLKIAKKYSVRIIKTRPEQFTYGYALNLGWQEASGETIVNLSAHAVPVDNHWLENLLGPLSENKKIVGVYGKQIPWPDCFSPEKEIIRKFYGDDYQIQKQESKFSNVNAAMLRKVLQETPFDESLSYAEDWDWVRKVQQKGYWVAYQPTAAVYHSHNESFKEIMKRTRKEVMAFALLNRYDGKYPRALGLPKNVLLQIFNDFCRFIQGELNWMDMKYALRYRPAKNIGRYLALLKYRKSVE